MRATQVVLCLGLCACDLVFPANRPPGDDDDDPIDAAVEKRCPEIGAPMFTSGATQIRDFCSDYTVSVATGFAMGRCADGASGGSEIVEGPADSPDLTIADVGADAASLSDVRLAPDGGSLFATFRTPGGGQIRMYRRSGMQWVLDDNGAIGLPLASSADDLNVSTPAGVDTKLIIAEQANLAMFTEYRNDGGRWDPVTGHAYTNTDLDAQNIKHPNLSEDGLRLVFMSIEDNGRVIRYTKRATTQERFAGSEIIADGVITAAHPQLTPTCDKLYLTDALGAKVITR